MRTIRITAAIIGRTTTLLSKSLLLEFTFADSDNCQSNIQISIPSISVLEVSSAVLENEELISFEDCVEVLEDVDENVVGEESEEVVLEELVVVVVDEGKPVAVHQFDLLSTYRFDTTTVWYQNPEFC